MRAVTGLFLFAALLPSVETQAASITFTNSASISIAAEVVAQPVTSSISTPAGAWELFAAADCCGAEGTIANGWSVILEILGGQIVDVDVVLSGLSHPFFPDLDVLVRGPNGIGVAFMTDLGQIARAVNATYVFNDAAAAPIPAMIAATSPLTLVPSGSYRPEGGRGPCTGCTSFGGSLAAFNGIAFADTEPAPVPEPATVVLMATGLAAMAVSRRRRTP